MEKVKVSVIIPTYNHERFIRRAVESALAQECSFPYEVLIGDDASTDATGEICREYAGRPGVRLIQHSLNRGLIGNYAALFREARGTCIAILEGDDFWENQKLERQIGHLDAHPDCGLVHSNGYLLFGNGKRRLIHREPVAPGTGYPELFRSNSIASVTACFRKELLQHADLERFVALGFRTIDYPLWLEFSRHTRIDYIHEPLATYRITAASISNNRSMEARAAFEASNRAILEYYLEKYPAEGLNPRLIEEKYQKKIYHAILACGSHSDLKMLPGKPGGISRFKRLALRNRIFFLVFRTVVRTFYRRV